ncbi:MAG: hypothetical protein ACK58L_09410 [Planctomycetota bacterium]
MRHLRFGLGLSLLGMLIGCGGPTDEVMEYDAKVSEEKSAEYAAQQKAGLENAMKQMKKGNRGNPNQR